MKTKFAVKKFDGDDMYSYAVFRAEDVKGIRGVVCYGQARPVVSGCSRKEAAARKQKLELLNS